MLASKLLEHAGYDHPQRVELKSVLPSMASAALYHGVASEDVREWLWSIAKPVVEAMVRSEYALFLLFTPSSNLRKPLRSPTSLSLPASDCRTVSTADSGPMDIEVQTTALVPNHSIEPPSASTCQRISASMTLPLVLSPVARLPVQVATSSLTVPCTVYDLNSRPTLGNGQSGVLTRFSGVSFTDGALRYIPLDLGLDYDIMEDEHGEQIVVCAADLQAACESAEPTPGDDAADVPQTLSNTDEGLMSLESHTLPKLDDSLSKPTPLHTLSTEDGFDTPIEDDLDIPSEEDISVPIRVAALHCATSAKIVFARRPPTAIFNDIAAPRHSASIKEVDEISHTKLTNHALADLSTVLHEEDQSASDGSRKTAITPNVVAHLPSNTPSPLLGAKVAFADSQTTLVGQSSITEPAHCHALHGYPPSKMRRSMSRTINTQPSSPEAMRATLATERPVPRRDPSNFLSIEEPKVGIWINFKQWICYH